MSSTLSFTLLALVPPVLFLAAPVGLLGAQHPPRTGSNTSRPNARPFLTVRERGSFPQRPTLSLASPYLPVSLYVQTSFRFRPRHTSDCWHLFLCSHVLLSLCPLNREIAHLPSSYLSGILQFTCLARLRCGWETRRWLSPNVSVTAEPVCPLLSRVWHGARST